ncbi:MAG: DNA polymerase III subunit delta' [Pseudomonadota bacterium]
MSAAWPLVGHAAAERAFLDAHASGRLHHAWLIEGPSGIGKARLAMRFSAFLLGARGPDTAPLDAAEDDPAVRPLLAESHPDLHWSARRPDEKGKLKQDIPVDEVRALNQFFTLKPALGGWRVGVIDSLDELNRSGANALLKTLEEPPPQAAIFLISHGARPVLPTIRSRCRTLRLNRLSDAETETVLVQEQVNNPAETARLAAGRPGQALKFAGATAKGGLTAADTVIKAWPRLNDKAFGDAVKHAGADEAAFEAFSLRVLAWLAEGATDDPKRSGAYLSTSALVAEADALAMPRAQAAAKLVMGLQKAAKAR